MMLTNKTDRTLILVLVLLGLTLLCSERVAQATTNVQTRDTTVYLPGVVKRFSEPTATEQTTPEPRPTEQPTATPTATGEPAAQGALWLPYRRNDNKVLPTYGASVAVDTQGGIHAAYSLLSATNEAEGGTITYAYCPVNCTVKANWSFVHLGDGIEARIQVDVQGHPRLIMMTSGVAEGQVQHLYFSYGVCDTGCTQVSNWTLTPLVHTLDCIACVGGREPMNHHYFALDPTGHPAFVFPSIDPADDSHAKLYYISCMGAPATCTQPEQWVPIQVGDGSYPYQPSLVFAGVGQPRLAYQIGNSLHSELYYLQCDQNCQAGNWSWQQIAATSTRLTVRFSLAVNKQNQPRLAFYASYENKDPSPFADGLLYYIWCDTNCTSNQDGAWQWSSIGLPVLAGEDPVLALDQQGHPRMAYMTHNQGLGYSWCNDQCETANGAWQHGVAESNDSLSGDYDVLPIQRCTVSTWFTGVRPSLTLDAQGNPRVAYDAQHYWYGTETVGGVVRECNIKDINVTRIAVFNQP